MIPLPWIIEKGLAVLEKQLQVVFIPIKQFAKLECRLTRELHFIFEEIVDKFTVINKNLKMGGICAETLKKGDGQVKNFKLRQVFFATKMSTLNCQCSLDVLWASLIAHEIGDGIPSDRLGASIDLCHHSRQGRGHFRSDGNFSSSPISEAIDLLVDQFFSRFGAVEINLFQERPS